MRCTIKSKNSGQPREYKGKQYGEQQVAMDIGADYPLVFKVNVEVGKELDPGEYTLSGQSFKTDEHGNLRLGRPVLVPVRATAKA